MLDISHKYPTLRTAVSEAIVNMRPETILAVREHKVPKGDPLELAKAAAALAAKNTPSIIPYCHPIPISFVGLEFEITDKSIIIKATVKAIAPTGVEMEAMTAVSVAALTIYDMLKMIDESITIEHLRLLSKRGGKSDFKAKSDSNLRAGVVVISDSVASGKNVDMTGVKINHKLHTEGYKVADLIAIPDDEDIIVTNLIRLVDEDGLDLVITTGGTGFGPRDRTPEAMKRVIEKEAPGVEEAMRSFGQQRTPYAMFSRSVAGFRRKSLIVNLPGSEKAVTDALNLLFPALHHALKMTLAQSGWSEHGSNGAE